ncbi:hypothetical protein KKI19_02290 [Patescibacteria group bacterium]|nr:hypothetical protein [Patescibacteria group bacterium]
MTKYDNNSGFETLIDTSYLKNVKEKLGVGEGQVSACNVIGCFGGCLSCNNKIISSED